VLRVELVEEDQQVLQVRVVHREPKVLREDLEVVVDKALKVLKVLLEHKEDKVLKETQDQQEVLVQQDQQVHKVLQGLKVPQVLREELVEYMFFIWVVPATRHVAFL
jgi:hypothetical protein